MKKTLLLCTLHVFILGAAASSSQQLEITLTPEEQEVYFALCSTGLSSQEALCIINANKSIKPDAMPPTSSSVTPPDPNFDIATFRAQMVANAKDKKFGQLGK